MSDKKFQYVNDSVVIDFPVPTALRDLMNEAEQADLEDALGIYLLRADDIDTVAKNCCGSGALTRKQWDMLCRRYPQ